MGKKINKRQPVFDIHGQGIPVFAPHGQGEDNHPSLTDGEVKALTSSYLHNERTGSGINSIFCHPVGIPFRLILGERNGLIHIRIGKRDFFAMLRNDKRQIYQNKSPPHVVIHLRENGSYRNKWMLKDSLGGPTHDQDPEITRKYYEIDGQSQMKVMPLHTLFTPKNN